MIGWLVAWKCWVACLFFEESQQPTCPHVRQRRRCTHVSPIFKQSSHPCALGVTSRIWSRCVHVVAIVSSSLLRREALYQSTARRGYDDGDHGGDGMTVYTIEPDEHSLHGMFSREFAPVLTI